MDRSRAGPTPAFTLLEENEFDEEKYSLSTGGTIPSDAKGFDDNDKEQDSRNETKQDTEVVGEQQSVSNDVDTQCGFFGLCTPKLLQPLANMNVFIILYILQDALRAMWFTYWTSCISTIEKRYRMPSRLVGSFSAMGEGGKIVCILLFAHYGGRGHRPRWMSLACLGTAIAAILLVVPEIYVPLPNQGDYASNLTSKSTGVLKRSADEMCQSHNSGSQGMFDQRQCETLEKESRKNVDSSIFSTKVKWAIAFFVCAHTVIDAVSPIPKTIGFPFIYDNVRLSETPIYYAMVALGHLIGPLSGYSLGSLINRIYIDPGNAADGLSLNDPQWIGAWYLGFIGMFGLDLIVAFLFLWFPRRVARLTSKNSHELHSSSNNEERMGLQSLVNNKVEEHGERKKPLAMRRYGEKGSQAAATQRRARLRDLPRDLYQLVKNPYILIVICARAIDVMGSAGFRHLTPKYLENHFRVTASKASFFTGISHVLTFIISGLIGAFVIKKFKLQPRTIAAVTLATQVVVALGTMSLAFFPCDGPRMAGQPDGPNQPFVLQSRCSADCRCTDASFTPVCDNTNSINYFSPCRAGCTQRITGAFAAKQLLQENQIDTGGRQFTEAYTNCSCLDDPQAVLTRGYCSSQSDANSSSCEKMFYWYTVTKMAIAFVGGLPMVGGTMLLFRLVEPELKSLAAGLIGLTTTLMGFLPGSYIAGSILDSACILWNKSSAQTDTTGCQVAGGGLTNCLLYDNRSMRLNFHLFVGFLRTGGLVFDAMALWWVWNVKFKLDDKVEKTSKRSDSNE